MQLVYISGSPCSGKSTIAKLLAQKYNYMLLQYDEYLYPFMDQLAREGNQICKRVMNYTCDEMWLRAPNEMCEDEIKIYHDIFPLLQKEIQSYSSNEKILVEGAGIMPWSFKEHNINITNYICIVPTRQFQLEKYSVRPWIKSILKECSDKKLAFENWMERDYLFSQYMMKNAEKNQYPYLIIDGSMDAKKVMDIVENTIEIK